MMMTDGSNSASTGTVQKTTSNSNARAAADPASGSRSESCAAHGRRQPPESVDGQQGAADAQQIRHRPLKAVSPQPPPCLRPACGSQFAQLDIAHLRQQTMAQGREQ